MMRRLGISELVLLAIIITAVAAVALAFLTFSRELLQESIMRYELSKSWVVIQYMPHGILKVENIGEDEVVLKDVYLTDDRGSTTHIFNGHEIIKPGKSKLIPLKGLKPKYITVRICLTKGGYCKVLKYKVEVYEVTAYSSKGGRGVERGLPPKANKTIIVNKTAVKNAIVIVVNDQYSVEKWIVEWAVSENSRVPGVWVVYPAVEYLRRLNGVKEGTGRWVGVIRLSNSSYPVTYEVKAWLRPWRWFEPLVHVPGGIGRLAPTIGVKGYSICAILPHHVRGLLKNAGEGALIELDVLCTEQPLFNVEYHGKAPLIIFAFISFEGLNFIIPMKVVRGFFNETITLIDSLDRLFAYPRMYTDEFYIGPEDFIPRCSSVVSLGLILAIPRDTSIKGIDVRFMGVKGDWVVSTHIDGILRYASAVYMTYYRTFRLRTDLRVILLSGVYRLIAVYVKIDLNKIDDLARLITLKGPVARIKIEVEGGQNVVWVYSYNVGTIVVRGDKPYHAFVLLTQKGKTRLLSSVDYPWLNGGTGRIHDVYAPLRGFEKRGKPTYDLGIFENMTLRLCTLRLCNDNSCMTLKTMEVWFDEWYDVEIYALYPKDGVLVFKRLSGAKVTAERTLCRHIDLTYNVPDDAVLVYVVIRLYEEGASPTRLRYSEDSGVACKPVKEEVLGRQVIRIVIKGKPRIYIAWFDRDERKVMYAELRGGQWYIVIKEKVKKVYKCDDGRTYENIETITRTENLGTVDLTYALGLSRAKSVGRTT